MSALSLLFSSDEETSRALIQTLNELELEVERCPEIFAAVEKILAFVPDDPVLLALIAHDYAVSGRGAEARTMVAKLQQMSAARYVPSVYIALIYTGLNDKDEAFRWLDKAFDERCEYLVYLPTEPLADPLRNDPRFAQLLHRLGLTA